MKIVMMMPIVIVLVQLALDPVPIVARPMEAHQLIKGKVDYFIHFYHLIKYRKVSLILSTRLTILNSLYFIDRDHSVIELIRGAPRSHSIPNSFGTSSSYLG